MTCVFHETGQRAENLPPVDKLWREPREWWRLELLEAAGREVPLRWGMCRARSGERVLVAEGSQDRASDLQVRWRTNPHHHCRDLTSLGLTFPGALTHFRPEAGRGPLPFLWKAASHTPHHCIHVIWNQGPWLQKDKNMGQQDLSCHLGRQLQLWGSANPMRGLDSSQVHTHQGWQTVLRS